jgi:predicted AlkP superfamily pyrophosphatase or phosphodiesterase
MTSRTALPVPQNCAPYNRLIPAGKNKSVGTHLFAREAGDISAIGRSPESDLFALNLADAIVTELSMGQRGTTDLLAIALAATDYIGHAYGTHGVEMCVQLMALDAMLGDFFNRLDERGINYVAMLTADHGGLDLPERQSVQGAPDAARLISFRAWKISIPGWLRKPVWRRRLYVQTGRSAISISTTAFRTKGGSR